MNLTLFDLDHTLLPLDSDYAWGEFLVRIGAQDATVFAQRNAEFYAAYQAGTLDIYAYVEFLMAALQRHPRAQIEAWQTQYLSEMIAPQIRPEALALVRQHQIAGDLCAIVTATNRFVSAPIAQMFGVEHLIATEPEQTTQGAFTGKILGTPCFREGKIVRVEAWLSSQHYDWQDFPHSTFYSDSLNDLPLLQRVSHPVATNPDAHLLHYAQQQGWPVLHLFPVHD